MVESYAVEKRVRTDTDSDRSVRVSCNGKRLKVHDTILVSVKDQRAKDKQADLIKPVESVESNHKGSLKPKPRYKAVKINKEISVHDCFKFKCIAWICD